MNTISTLIIVLSVFGLYINMYGNTNLLDPELMDTSWLAKLQQIPKKENNEMPNTIGKLIDELELDPKITEQAKNISPGEIDSMIQVAKKHVSPDEYKKYNEIGEKRTSETTPKILNLGKNTKGGVSTRLYGWSRPSSVDKIDGNSSLTKENITYKNNYPYKNDELRMKSGDSKIIESYTNLTDRVFKQDGTIGAMILPKNTDAFDIDNSYTKRATSIYKTRISYTNKVLPDVQRVDIGLLKERDNLKLSALNEISDGIEIKTRPDMTGFKNNVEHMKTHEILYPIDKIDADMKNISRNYNLK